MRNMKINSALLCGAALFASQIVQINSALAQESSVLSGDRVFYGGCVAVDDLLLRPEKKEVTDTSGAEAFGFLATLGSAFIGPFVKNTLSRFGTALKRASGKDVPPKVITVVTPIELIVGEISPCVQLVSGSFFASADGGDKINAGLGPRIDDDKLRENNILISGTPSLFMEFAINRSIDQSALTLAPTYFHYGAIFEKRFEEQKKRSKRNAEKRGIVGAVSFHPVGAEYTADSARGAEIIIGQVSVGGSKSYRVLPAPPANPEDKYIQIDDPTDIVFKDKIYFAKFEQESEWFANFNPLPKEEVVETGGDDSSDSDEVDSDFGGGGAADGKKDPVYKPMNLTIKMTETRNVNQFLFFLSEIFDGGQEAAETAITNQLTPSSRRTARIAALNAELQASNDYDGALLTAKNAIDAYCNGPTGSSVSNRTERRSLSATARSAQGAVNTKALIAGSPPPFSPPLIAISGGAIRCPS